MLLLFVLANTNGITQTPTQSVPLENQLQALEAELDLLKKEQNIVEEKIIDIKEAQIIEQLKTLGLPSQNYIEHSAMILEYDEQHEQAKWVAHMIPTDIEKGAAYRSNDFRIDPKIKTGTAVQEDYFLTDTLADGKVEYDGYGYDRGHLAPSADFRWSPHALSESYFYSNMSPQVADFNREIWAELENFLRRYVLTNKASLSVITAPILNDNLKKVERSINKVSIPEYYVKAVYDKTNNRAIGFILANAESGYPLETFAVSIDDVEKRLGYNIFTNVPEEVESQIDKEKWFEALASGDAEPIYQPSLPSAHFNTVVAKNKIGKEVIVCGKVVATRFSKKGHLWLNLDKQFPNHIFSVYIKKNDLVNFPNEILNYYKNETYCFEGKIQDFSGIPTINLSNPNRITSLKK